MGTDFADALQDLGAEAIREAISRARPVAVRPIESPPAWLHNVPPIGDDTDGPLRIAATPYVCRDPATIPPRPWVYGRMLLRGSLSLVVAPGATGKTALLAGTALALATGRALHDKAIWDGPKRVWLWNLEDSAEELARLIEGGRKHWGIAPDDIGDRLFVDSALSGSELKMAIEDRAGFRIVRPVVEALVEELKARQVDVLIIDPFVSSHSASENDNGAIDAIAKEWARIGVRANCAILLVHHTRKLGGAEAGSEQARGASALVGAARSVLALNKMTADEAQGFGVEGEERRRFFRAYDDKNNRTPPADKSDWYRLASVDLGNGPSDRDGDSVPVVLPWQPPDAFTGVTVDHLRRVQEKVKAGSYRHSVQSGEWVGFAVAQVLDLDVSDTKGPDAARVKKLIAKWLSNGVLVTVQREDKKRNLRPFIEAGRELTEADASP